MIATLLPEPTPHLVCLQQNSHSLCGTLSTPRRAHHRMMLNMPEAKSQSVVLG